MENLDNPTYNLSPPPKLPSGKRRMEWLRQAFPGTPQEVFDIALSSSQGDFIKAVAKTRWFIKGMIPHLST
jgi:hypothetical protein